MQLLSWLRQLAGGQIRRRPSRNNRPTARWRPRLEVLEGRDVPSTLTVTTSVDEMDPNDGVLSLREAVAAANSGDKITFASNVSASDLTLGQLVINRNLTIEGQSKFGGYPTTYIFDGDGRAFDVVGSINVTFANVGIYGYADHGGGVLNEGASLTLSNCRVGGTAVVIVGGRSGVAGNVAGGALYNAAGIVSISNSQIVGQAIAYDTTAEGSSALGGGIYNAAGATLLVTNCTFSYSTTNSGASNAVAIGGYGFLSGYAAGGAIYNAGGSVSLTNTDIEGAFTVGSIVLGGAIFNSAGSLSITNCTFDGNSAEAGYGGTTAAGGGIYVAGGSVQIQSSTITGNTTFGGLGNDIYIAAGSVCISKNSTIGDIFGPYSLC
jgi:CSLREA domain-containing protein